MVVHYCRCHIAAQVEDYNEAHWMLQIAKAQFMELNREYWWTCIGTDLLDRIRDSLAGKNMISGINLR